MGGRRRWRTVSALMVAVVVASTGCQSSEADDRATGGDGAAAESILSSSSLTPSVAPSTTQTTAATTTSTESTLAESAQAEAAIEAAIVGWWTAPFDTSLGDDGLALEYVTGALFQRIRGLAEQRTNAGEIQRSTGKAQVRIVDTRIDLDAGTAKIDLCTLGVDELLDAATGEVLFVDVSRAFSGSATMARVGEEWKIADFFTTQGTRDPVECEIE